MAFRSSTYLRKIFKRWNLLFNRSISVGKILSFPPDSFLLCLRRRKDYSFVEVLEEGEGECPFPLESNVQSVKHFRISTTQLPEDSILAFPNVTQLTMEYYHEQPDEFFLINLNRLIPLKEVTRLNLVWNGFTIEDLLRLLGLMPNLHTLKFSFSSVDEDEMKSHEQSAVFQEICSTNRIRHVYSSNQCDRTLMEIFLKLFPRMEYLQTYFDRKKINEVILHIFRENFRSLHPLTSLCLVGGPKICFKEIDRLIKTKNLLDHYQLKCLNYYLYIWW